LDQSHGSIDAVALNSKPESALAAVNDKIHLDAGVDARHAASW
jgi:hypothetical protein